jgi:XTP/dITP diphosphohydrolase
MPLVIATTNPHKAVEIDELLSKLDVLVLTPDDFTRWPEVEEDGSTFAQNALKKATTVYREFGIPAMADDSGLEVDVLGGEPGVLSARYAGVQGDYAANNEKLLRMLDGVPKSRRTARFRCAIAIVWGHRKDERAIVEAVARGRIVAKPKGRGGFGYDPLFLYPKLGKTFAQLSRKDKSVVSHRGRALRRAKTVLRRLARTGVI